MIIISVVPCIMVLGGSFDPIHNGHIMLCKHFFSLLQPLEIRIVPVCYSLKKSNLQASSIHRIKMLKLAFNTLKLPVVIDTIEIQCAIPYTIHTLKILRMKFGYKISIIFLMGFDQLIFLNTWKNWQQLFEYVHICIASRPRFSDAKFQKITFEVKQEFNKRITNIQTLRTLSHGKTYFSSMLNINISSTKIRHILQKGGQPISLMPIHVLNYINQYSLYKN